MNRLFFGDNLDVMREYMDDDSVDLVYLDPPFNSKAQYNVIFDRQPGSGSAQAGAFLDSWEWGEESERCYSEVMRSGGAPASMLQALRGAIGPTPLMAYLTMMTPRLQELRRILKPTGSLYLHCDPSAGHYLKVILDQIFGGKCFQSEIVWRRTNGHNFKANKFATVHDTIFFYRDPKGYFCQQYGEYSEGQLRRFKRDEAGRLYKAENLTFSTPNPTRQFEWRGTKPSPKRSWGRSYEELEEMWAAGRILTKKDGSPRLDGWKIYLEETDGKPFDSVWTDIPRVQNTSAERIGYPTQKPRALLDRILLSSSKEDMVVFDPFCGCGTTIESAEELGRRWIGIDVAIHAVRVIEERLKDNLGHSAVYEVEGIPSDFESAKRLAARDKYQFEWWANYLFNPYSVRERKKGGDRGIDGELFFPNGPGRPYGKILTSVKGGDNLNPGMVRDFRGVLERENAEMGIFICLHEPTKGMLREAVQAGYADIVHGQMPRLQIVSIKGFFQGERPQLPPLPMPGIASMPARRKAALKKRKRVEEPELLLTFTDEPLSPNAIPKPAHGEVRHINPAYKDLSA